MQCEFCDKIFKTCYILKNHKNTTKSCLLIQGKIQAKEPRKFNCTFCNKYFTANSSLKYHLSICKNKPNEELLSIMEDKIKKEMSSVKRMVEQSSRKMEYKLEDEIEKLQQSVISKEEHEAEIRIKDEHNKKLEERIKELEEKVKHPNLINNSNNNNQVNNQVYHNNLTIHNYMTPERVTEIFDKHYTIETLMGGQKALANFVVDQFVAGPDKMVYLCVDRSRKKCMYTTDFQTFHEDVNNEILLSQLTPAMHIIKDKVEWLSTLSPQENINRLGEYEFCICPEGNGVDTHRLWEALYSKTIPIVIDSEFTKVLQKNNISLIVLQKWSDLDVSTLVYHDFDIPQFNIS
jgi:hypothetical protein